jgi:hypothetical protein
MRPRIVEAGEICGGLSSLARSEPAPLFEQTLEIAALTVLEHASIDENEGTITQQRRCAGEQYNLRPP